MVSQEKQVEDGSEETTTAADKAEFAGAWDSFDAEETGQPAPAAGRQDDQGGEPSKDPNEAGQSAAQEGQPAADAPPAADAGQPASRAISDDVLANVDPAVRAHIEQLEEEKRKAQNAARSNGGRLSQALNELHALRQSLGPKTEGSDGTAPAGTKDERIEQLRKDYPDVAEPILDQIAGLEKRVETLAAGATAKAESEVVAALEDNLEALKARHPDLSQVVVDPAYAEWVKAQTPAIQRIVQENSEHVVNADDAALVFDLFKQSRQQADPAAAAAARAAGERRKAQLDAGRTATGKGPTASSDARPDGGSYDDAWNEFEREDSRKVAGRR